MLRTFDDIYETMPWDAVDAVVFDVGQVLLSYNPQEILDEHVPDRPDLHPILLEKIFRSPYWLMRDHGLMTRDEAIEAMIGRDEPLRPYITRVMHNWVDLKKVLPEGLKTLQSCKAHGKRSTSSRIMPTMPLRLSSTSTTFLTSSTRNSSPGA